MTGSSGIDGSGHEGHQSVMVSEVLSALAPRAGDVFADLTLGVAGHARAILDRVLPGGRLIGFDADPEMLERATLALTGYEGSFELHCGFFDRVASVVGGECPKFDGILMDLGIASIHLDETERGFGFSRDGPLDMRLDRSSRRTAAEIVNRASMADLEGMFREYGQERYARRIAREIVFVRNQRPLTRTGELAELVVRVVRRTKSRPQRIHPATRVFQALRIAVNDELARLERALEQCCGLLKEEGRMVVLSFHSLEDGRVKRAFRQWARDGRALLQVKKPLRPTEDEVRANPRARSARLRAITRIGA